VPQHHQSSAGTVNSNRLPVKPMTSSPAASHHQQYHQQHVAVTQADGVAPSSSTQGPGSKMAAGQQPLLGNDGRASKVGHSQQQQLSSNQMSHSPQVHAPSSGGRQQLQGYQQQQMMSRYVLFPLMINFQFVYYYFFSLSSSNEIFPLI
jgi:hypothetical protein